MSAADGSGFSAERLERELDREAGALGEDLVAQSSDATAKHRSVLPSSGSIDRIWTRPIAV
jgi:hypothetical protein